MASVAMASADPVAVAEMAAQVAMLTVVLTLPLVVELSESVVAFQPTPQVLVATESLVDLVALGSAAKALVAVH